MESGNFMFKICSKHAGKALFKMIFKLFCSNFGKLVFNSNN